MTTTSDDDKFDTTWSIERELAGKGIYREKSKAPFDPGYDMLWKADTQPHYTASAIQPIDYNNANNLDFLEGNIVKYVTRWRHKDGIKDLEKLVDYAQRLLKREQDRAAK